MEAQGANVAVVIYCSVVNASLLIEAVLNSQSRLLKKYCLEQGHYVAGIFKEQVSRNFQSGVKLQQAMNMIERNEEE